LKLSSLLNYFLFKQFHFSSLRVSYVVLFGVNGKRGVLLGKHVPLTCIIWPNYDISCGKTRVCRDLRSR